MQSKTKQAELDKLEARISGEFNHASRVRKAVWLVNNASSIEIEFNADEKHE